MATAGIATATHLVVRNNSTCHCGEPAVWLSIDWERHTTTPLCQHHFGASPRRREKST